MARCGRWQTLLGFACLCIAPPLLLLLGSGALSSSRSSCAAGMRPADCELLGQFDLERRARVVPRDPAELPFVLAHLYCGVPLSFIRYGDGEIILIRGDKVTAQAPDKWHWPGGASLLGADINRSLAEPPRGLEHYAALGCFPWIDHFSPYVVLPTRYLSTATVFINENYGRFKEELGRWTRAFTRETSPFVVVANVETNATRVLQWAHDFVALPNEGPLLWQDLRQVFLSQFTALARAHSGRIFLISGGPPAKAILYHMALANPNNTYLDVGSATDEYLKGKFTRPYQKSNSRAPCKMYTRDPDTGRIHFVE
eukprot:m51a1_g10118 hypothetical protein (313) ;mRNA; r:39363-40385